jgi:hypothetical protein
LEAYPPEIPGDDFLTFNFQDIWKLPTKNHWSFQDLNQAIFIVIIPSNNDLNPKVLVINN